MQVKSDQRYLNLLKNKITEKVKRNYLSFKKKYILLDKCFCGLRFNLSACCFNGRHLHIHAMLNNTIILTLLVIDEMVKNPDCKNAI